VKKSFKTYLAEGTFRKGDPVNFTDPRGQLMNGTYEGPEKSNPVPTTIVICHKSDNSVMGMTKGEFLVPTEKVKLGHVKTKGRA
jgi:hypothetical protein